MLGDSSTPIGSDPSRDAIIEHCLVRCPEPDGGPMVGNACLFAWRSSRGTIPPSLVARAQATRPPCACKVARSCLARFLFWRRAESGVAICEPRGREDGPAWRGNGKQTEVASDLAMKNGITSCEHRGTLRIRHRYLPGQRKVQHP